MRNVADRRTSKREEVVGRVPSHCWPPVSRPLTRFSASLDRKQLLVGAATRSRLAR